MRQRRGFDGSGCTSSVPRVIRPRRGRGARFGLLGGLICALEMGFGEEMSWDFANQRPGDGQRCWEVETSKYSRFDGIKGIRGRFVSNENEAGD